MNTIKLTLRIEEITPTVGIMKSILSHDGLKHVSYEGENEITAIIQDTSASAVIEKLGLEIIPLIRSCSVTESNKSETKLNTKFK